LGVFQRKWASYFLANIMIGKVLVDSGSIPAALDFYNYLLPVGKNAISLIVSVFARFLIVSSNSSFPSVSTATDAMAWISSS